MAHKVFIDGEAGTTGLQIRERLSARSDITLVQIADDRRKDPQARLEACIEADVAILCLPDEAAKEIAALSEGKDVRLIDASTAHRTDPDWVFGFPEMTPGQREAIASAARVSNPGCWSTCAIAILRPLAEAGLIDAENPPALSGVSGYSGGGKAMIAEFANGETSGAFLYGAAQKHKHLPEIKAHGLLARAPVFVPAVGHYEKGMAVCAHLRSSATAAQIEAALARAYEGQGFVKVLRGGEAEARINPQRLNGTNLMEISVQGDEASGSVAIIAVLDNLGKGASGAAVQNLNIMLGADEFEGLI